MEKHNYKGVDGASEKKKIEQHGLFIETIINEYTDEQQNGFVMDLINRIAEHRQNRKQTLERELDEVGMSLHELKHGIGVMLGLTDKNDFPLLPKNY